MHNASRWAVFGLFFFSGSCALIYQITWMRLFRLAMGNTVFTSATVLTAFMAGLALGSWLAGRLADRTGRPLRVYAYLEVLIGLCGLAMTPAFNALEPVYGWLYHGLDGTGIWLGVGRFLASAAGANLLIGALAFTLADAPSANAPADEPAPSRSDLAALWALGLTGFASMIYEVSWTRTLSLLLGSSVYAFTLMLVAFICGLGLGSMVLAGWIDRRARLFRTLALLELAVGLTALLVEPLFGLLPLAVVELVNRYAGSFGLLHLSEFLMAFGLMFLPTFAAGGIFPAAAKLYTRHLSKVGKSVGDAYAANTLGAVLGAFCRGLSLDPSHRGAGEHSRGHYPQHRTGHLLPLARRPV